MLVLEPDGVAHIGFSLSFFENGFGIGERVAIGYAIRRDGLWSVEEPRRARVRIGALQIAEDPLLAVVDQEREDISVFSRDGETWHADLVASDVTPFRLDMLASEGGDIPHAGRISLGTKRRNRGSNGQSLHGLMLAPASATIFPNRDALSATALRPRRVGLHPLHPLRAARTIPRAGGLWFNGGLVRRGRPRLAWRHPDQGAPRATRCLEHWPPLRGTHTGGLEVEPDARDDARRPRAAQRERGLGSLSAAPRALEISTSQIRFTTPFLGEPF